MSQPNPLSTNRWLYREIERLVGDVGVFLRSGGYLKLKSEGFMDLVIEAIASDEISMAHYYRQNGDLMKDPEMTLRVHVDMELVSPLTFEMSNPPRYDCVNEDGRVNVRLQRDLEKFLRIWFRNIRQQRFPSYQERAQRN